MQYEPFAVFAAKIQAFLPLEVHTDDAGVFQGGMSHRSIEDTHLMHIDADAHTVQRTTSHTRISERTYVKLTFVQSGEITISQNGRESRVTSGSWVLYDTNRPYRLQVHSRTKLSVLMIPLERCTLSKTVRSHLSAIPISESSGLSTLVEPLIAKLSMPETMLDDMRLRRMVNAVIDLVNALIDDLTLQYENAAGSTRYRDATDYIETHLSDPGLSPATIAQALFVSVRTVHAVFREHGTSVSVYIRNRRLERCAEELAVRDDSITISGIAAACGFTDMSHFSRAFKTRFGIPPGVFKQSRTLRAAA